jgi:4-hydroxybenzoate polyprenyltransferase
MIEWEFLSDYLTPGGYYMTSTTWRPLLMIGLIPLLMLLARAWFWFILQVIGNLGYTYYIYWSVSNYLNPKTNVLLYGSIYLLYLISLIIVGRKWEEKRRGKKPQL